MATWSWQAKSLLAALVFAAATILVGEDYISGSLQREQGYNESFFTQTLSQTAQARAERWFRGTFEETGLIQASFDAFIPDAEARGRDPQGLQTLGQSPVFTWWEARTRSFWAILWTATLRLSHAALWIPWGLFLVIPWLIDGWVSRRIRQHTFALSSPITHSYALTLLQVLVVAAVGLLFVPVPLHPALLPAGLLLAGFLMHRAIANFMKRA
jgi:hypothetical protein